MSFIPLLGILVLVGGVFFLRTIILRFWSLNSGMMKHLFIAYIGLLILATVVTYMIPTDNHHHPSIQAGIHASQAAHEVRQAVIEGRLPESKHLIEKGRWSFQYKGEQINILSKHASRQAHILVERLPSADDTVVVTYYTTPHVIENYDYTHHVHAPEVILVDHTIYVVPTSNPHDRLSFKRFEQEYYVTPFLSSSMQEFRGTRHERGEQLIYVQVPQHIEIITDNMIEKKKVD